MSWIGINEKEVNIEMENRRKAWKRATRNIIYKREYYL